MERSAGGNLPHAKFVRQLGMIGEIAIKIKPCGNTVPCGALILDNPKNEVDLGEAPPFRRIGSSSVQCWSPDLQIV